MDNNYDPLSGIEWLKRAKSNLNRGKESHDLEARGIFIEDLCFDLQQCAEKALKALLIHNDIRFPKTHDIGELLNLIKNNTTIEIPESIEKAKRLSIYAVITRYPSWNKISLEKYDEALVLAETVYNWAKEQLIRTDF